MAKVFKLGEVHSPPCCLTFKFPSYLKISWELGVHPRGLLLPRLHQLLGARVLAPSSQPMKQVKSWHKAGGFLFRTSHHLSSSAHAYPVIIQVTPCGMW